MPRMSLMSRPKICSSLFTNAKLQFSTSTVQFKSHYDTLGITPKATQNDIKSAYYKLTKLYHPDKNKTESAKIKFRDVTDAYEILGNYKSRRMYDRGMRPSQRQMDNKSQQEVKEEDAQTRFYKARLYRTQVPTASGRTPIYDFDEWARAHYGNLFNERIRAKQSMERFERYRIQEEISNQNIKIFTPIVVLFLLFSLVVMATNIDGGYDQNRLTNDKKDPKSS